jgi:predicted nucleotidyltransferase
MRTQQIDEYGFSESDRNELFRVFSHYPSLQKVILFGSRAKGNFRKGSDVDLAIVTNSPSRKMLASLHDELEEEAHIPYFFDVVDADTISSKELLQHIYICGKEIYKRV